MLHNALPYCLTQKSRDNFPHGDLESGTTNELQEGTKCNLGTRYLRYKLSPLLKLTQWKIMAQEVFMRVRTKI